MSPVINLELTTPELSFTASGGATVSRTVHPSGLRILTEKVPGAAAHRWVSGSLWGPGMNQMSPMGRLTF